ncbi:MAG: hypothetical protein PUP92_15935 [Rhizonema sp. PD38]|nr:hypothetical protein [Rhizonema sp. PD38]
MTHPKFSRNQLVRFVGGTGVIVSYYLNSNTWTYTVEMEMGPEPSMGRVGAETMLLLHEIEIKEAMY